MGIQLPVPGCRMLLRHEIIVGVWINRISLIMHMVGWEELSGLGRGSVLHNNEQF